MVRAGASVHCEVEKREEWSKAMLIGEQITRNEKKMFKGNAGLEEALGWFQVVSV